jgi:hypothetical protein
VIVGDIALRFPEANNTLLEWSVDENFWLRRLAIDRQLARKDSRKQLRASRVFHKQGYRLGFAGLQQDEPRLGSGLR